jgi:hypothetical protein
VSAVQIGIRYGRMIECIFGTKTCRKNSSILLLSLQLELLSVLFALADVGDNWSCGSSSYHAACIMSSQSTYSIEQA